MKKKLIIILAAAVLIAAFVPLPATSAGGEKGGYRPLISAIINLSASDGSAPEQNKSGKTTAKAEPGSTDSADEKAQNAGKASAAITPDGKTADNPDNKTDTVTGITQAPGITTAEPIPDFYPPHDFHSIRVSVKASDWPQNTVTFIRSRAELDKFISDFGDVYNLGADGSFGAGFEAEVSKYDDGYFKEHALILFTSTEGSGSTAYTGVYVGDGIISVERWCPEVSTDDMAYWINIIERPKSDPVFSLNPADIQVIFSE